MHHTNHSHDSFKDIPPLFSSRKPKNKQFQDLFYHTNTARREKTKFNELPHAFSSTEFTSSKQNQQGQYLFNSAFLNGKMLRSKAKEKRLKNMKKYHSEKLLREFTRQLQQVSRDSNQSQDGDIEQRLKRLQGTVKVLSFVRGLLQNHQKGGTSAIGQLQFGVGTIIDTYETRLIKKEQEIRQLKRRIAYLNSFNEQKQEKVNQFGVNAKNLFQESFGSVIQKISFPSSLMNSRQSFRGAENKQIYSQKTSFLYFGEGHETTKTPVNESIYIEEKGSFDNDQSEEQSVVINYGIQRLHQIDQREETTSRGYETGRFAVESFSPIRANQIVQFKKQTKKLEIINLQQMCIQPNQFQNHIQKQTINTKIEQECQTNLFLNRSNQYSQTDNQSTIRIRTESIFSDGKLGKTETGSQIFEQINAETQKIKEILPTFGAVSISINPVQNIVNTKQTNKDWTKFSKAEAISATLNVQYQGTRFKTHKSLTKLIVQLLGEVWRFISKIPKVYQTPQQKSILNKTKQRLHVFTDNFNSVYCMMKSPQKKYISQEFYQQNIKELREIQELLKSLMSHKI